MGAGKKARAAAIYCRISQDRTGGALGVQRQEELCRRLADEKCWPVAEVYVDNDLTAYRGKPRPEYERMLAAMEAGTVDAVVCVDIDRLTRAPAELERFISVADQHGVALANVSGDTDLSTSDGRDKARIMGAVARQESEKKSERLKRQREQAARLGLPNGGRRPYGYEPGGMIIREDEAEHIREAARRLLAGESLRTIARDFNDRRIANASGRRWMVTSLRTLLAGPRIAGLRVHLGEIVGEAAWPAVIDRKTHERVRAILGDPRRRQQRGRPPTNLLTSLLTCGRCGHTLYASTRTDGSRRYTCNPIPGTDRCGRLSVTADALEQFVSEAVLHALESGELTQAVASANGDDDSSALIEQLQADEASLEQLARDHYADRRIGRAEYLAARDAVQAHIDHVRAELRQQEAAAAALTLPDEGTLRSAWKSAIDDDIEWCRRVLLSVLDEIVVQPAEVRGLRRFDEGRVKFTWRV